MNIIVQFSLRSTILSDLLSGLPVPMIVRLGRSVRAIKLRRGGDMRALHAGMEVDT